MDFDFSKQHILVVGDVMLDRYWHGRSDRLSPEAPVPVVNVSNDRQTLGGAANVAANITSLGAQCTLLGVIGNDPAGQSVQNLLHIKKIHNACIIGEDIQTIEKLRIVSRSQQLLRVDFEGPLSPLGLTEQFAKLLKNVDLVILSDYGKGTLSDAPSLIRLARNAGKTVLVDPKSSDWQLYWGASLIKPNLKEFREAHGTEENLIDKAGLVCQKYQLEHILLTESERGMTLCSADGNHKTFKATAKDVFDVTGAGDTVMATLALGLAKGLALAEAVALSNTAAGLVVMKFGTNTNSAEELRIAATTGVESIVGKCVTLEMLIALVKTAQNKGEKVVFTNGCFDVVHLGHARCLAAAKSHGHKLIVAINSDASVKGLKGPKRPIHPLYARMELIANLPSVDWVISFDAETPYDLIARLLPDVLVKGGDYDIETIVGADVVQQHGGKVITIPLVDNFSSSRIIEKESIS